MQRPHTTAVITVTRSRVRSSAVPPESVDVAFSVGVLHHTPDPKRCFFELVRRVRPGGRVIAWVYGRENNGWIVHGISPLREAITSRLPHKWVYQLSKLPAAMLYALGKGIYQPLQKGPLEPIGEVWETLDAYARARTAACLHVDTDTPLPDCGR